MATPLDFVRAKVLAYKNTLEGKPTREKEKHVSIQIAEQVNSFMEEIKREFPEATHHLPPPITWIGMGALDMRISDVRFLELEMMLNQVLAILDVLRGAC
jgi:hypothetical protein